MRTYWPNPHGHQSLHNMNRLIPLHSVLPRHFISFSACRQCIGTTIPHEVEALLNRRMAHNTISNQESLMYFVELVELQTIISSAAHKRETSQLSLSLAINKSEMKEIADKLHELMVLHPDTSYDEFVTHVNNKMTRSLTANRHLTTKQRN